MNAKYVAVFALAAGLSREVFSSPRRRVMSNPSRLRG